MNRIRIYGQITHTYEQIIELSDDELQNFRKDLDHAKNKGDQAIDDFLGENYGGTDPIDWSNDDWSAELINNDGQTIEDLNID